MYPSPAPPSQVGERGEQCFVFALRGVDLGVHRAHAGCACGSVQVLRDGRRARVWFARQLKVPGGLCLQGSLQECGQPWVGREGAVQSGSAPGVPWQGGQRAGVVLGRKPGA